MSSRLSGDKSGAYHRFRRRARTLGTLSRSFDNLATSTTTAYLAVLTAPTTEAWTTLLARTDLLVRRAQALRGIIELDATEREALHFFEAIVRENADLLAVSLVLKAAAARAEFTDSLRASKIGSAAFL